MDREETIGRLRAAFGHGLLERDGEVVGMWHVRHPSGPGRSADPTATATWRTPCGRLATGTVGIAGLPHVAHGEGTARLGDAFGTEVAALMAMVRDHPIDGRTSDVTRMVSHAREIDRLLDWGAAAGIVHEATEGLRRTVRAFLSTLDPTAVKVLEAYPHDAGMLAHHWDLLDRSVTPSAPLSAALARHPGLQRTLCAIARRLGPERFVAEASDPRALDALIVRELRDVPHRLLPAVAAAERALADVAARHGEAAGQEGGWHLHHVFLPRQGDHDWPVRLVLDLAEMPHAWVPRDEAQWRAYLTAHPVVALVRRMVTEGSSFRDETPSRSAEVARILNVSGDWCAWVDRLMSITGAKDGEGLVRALADTGDVTRSYERQVVVPAACAAARANGRPVRPPDPEEDDATHSFVASRVVFGGRTLARVLQVSAEWHRRQPTMAAAIAAMPGAFTDESGWAPRLPDATRDGVEVRVLTDAASLVAEGAHGPDLDGVDGLANCVGGYADNCASGRSRVVSVRRPLPGGGFERLSVAELRVCDGSLGVVQHVGHGNGQPPEACARVLAWYVGALLRGDLAWECPEPVPSSGGLLNDVERQGGFDPYVDGTRLAVQDLWAQFVPKPLRRLDGPLLEALCDWRHLEPWPIDLGLDRVQAEAAASRERAMAEVDDPEQWGCGGMPF